MLENVFTGAKCGFGTVKSAEFETEKAATCQCFRVSPGICVAKAAGFLVVVFQNVSDSVLDCLVRNRSSILFARSQSHLCTA